MRPCLNSDELTALVQADASASGPAVDHVRECASCRLALGRLRSGSASGGDATLEWRPAPEEEDSGPPRDEIEGYEILDEIHRGGQGVVYRAVQRTTNRVVALKVLREGPFASPEQRYRFRREVDLVAKLNHPTLVTIFDSGISRGRPFFAMELVEGLPLDEHVLRLHLDVRQTLELFRKVCAGIHHAHLRGVIHRDLKPGNILVDAAGEPHVLDFGMAKLAGEGVPPAGAPVTLTGEFVGTLAYCSPEQARGETDLVDIRSDVYSLGVILYKILTDEHPYPVVGSVGEVLRNVASEEPRKPSSVRKVLPEDIDTIVLEALAKERDRRYQSVEALSRDIEHFLAGRPIEARRDSTFYVLEKTLRRYQLAVGAAVVLAAMVTTFTIVVARQARRIADERDRAEQARARSERDAERAEMAATAWYRAWAREESPVPVLRRALELNRMALGDDDPDLALHLYNLAAALELDARSDPDLAARTKPEIEALLREALALSRRTLPPGAPRVLDGIDLLARVTPNAAEKRSLIVEALALRRRHLPPDDPSLIASLEALAALAIDDDPRAGIQYLREALDVRRICLPVDAAGTASALERLAGHEAAWGALAEAVALAKESVDLRRAEVPDDHAGLAEALVLLGDLLVASGAAAEAEAPLREALDLRRAELPPFDPRVAVARASLGEALLAAGQVSEARDLLEVSVPTLEESLGPDAARTARAIRALADADRGVRAILPAARPAVSPVVPPDAPPAGEEGAPEP